MSIFVVSLSIAPTRCAPEPAGFEAARLLGVPPDVMAVKVAEVSLRASRPKYCALSNAKLAGAGITMPTWRDALARYLSRPIEACEFPHT